MAKFKVAYATGSRADYGIVRRYLQFLDKDKDIDFSILATGAHVDSRYGSTINIIEKDGFYIESKININIENTSNEGILNSVAMAISRFGEVFEKVKYDLLIILGDRYEMMAVAIAAAMNGIPILHLHGGEVTYGNYDEFIRHCISKMSTFHFTSTSKYRNRVIQMGEAPERVFCLGALGAENCRNINEKSIDKAVYDLQSEKYFVVAFHPETLTKVSITDQLQEVLQGLMHYVNDYKIVMIGTNADTGSTTIKNAWMDFNNRNTNVYYFENLNPDSFLFLVKNSIALIGNSSSGIIEAPSLGVNTVNIGNRQKGRVSGESVINVKCISKEIIEAMQKTIDLKAMNKEFKNPYYIPNTAENYYQTTKNPL